jgi:hypothetical protein
VDYIESVTQTHMVYIITKTKTKKRMEDKKKERKKESYLCRGEERRSSRMRKGGEKRK